MLYLVLFNQHKRRSSVKTTMLCFSFLASCFPLCPVFVLIWANGLTVVALCVPYKYKSRIYLTLFQKVSIFPKIPEGYLWLSMLSKS